MEAWANGAYQDGSGDAVKTAIMNAEALGGMNILDQIIGLIETTAQEGECDD